MNLKLDVELDLDALRRALEMLRPDESAARRERQIARVPTFVRAAVTPKLSVCTGSVCTRHGSALVLEAAEGLACSTLSVNVVATKCMSACKGRQLTAGGDDGLLDSRASRCR